MDYLDPRKTHSHKIRLMVGYGLVSIALVLTAIILIYGASGYGINTKTGAVVQNGLLFVDSKPSGASIYLKGKNQNSTTAARLVLRAGNYDLTLKKAGYRDWQRKFTMTENSVARYAYPLLLPVSPTAQALKIYPTNPSFITESPDQHWLLVQISSSDPAVLSFDEYDASKPSQPNQVLNFPAGLLNNTDKSASTLSAVEWASDNDHLLVQHSFSGGSEFIVLNRTDPTKSFNVNRLFNSNPSQVALRNKKIDQLYIFNQSDGLLSLGEVAKASLQPLLNHVLVFKPVGSDLVSYVTDQNVATGKVMARIWNNGRTYPLYTFSAGGKYLIDAAQFQGHWYYVAGSDTASRVNIYKDPLNGLKDPDINRAIPLLSLGGSGASGLSFSTNSRFIGLQAGQKFGVYDSETQTNYQFTLQVALSGPMRWLDGHRWIGVSNGNIFVMDYDSTNQQVLTPTISLDGGYLDKNSTYLLSVTQITGSNSVALQATDLRAGTDAPKP